jgi:hypothetical protein
VAERFFLAAHTPFWSKRGRPLSSPHAPSYLPPHPLSSSSNHSNPRFMAMSTRLLISLRQCPSCVARHGSVRTWTSAAATSRSTPSSPPVPPPGRLPIRPPSNSVPDLCLGAGGKAPGFVQQMLFSVPVPEKQAKGTLSRLQAVKLIPHGAN